MVLLVILVLLVKVFKRYNCVPSTRCSCSWYYLWKLSPTAVIIRVWLNGSHGLMEWLHK